MERVKGGYVNLILSSKTIYTDAINALNSKKPIFIYDGTNVSIVDTIVLNNDNTITINGELTIATNGTLSPSGWKIKTPHLYKFIFSMNVINNDDNIDAHINSEIITNFNPIIDNTSKDTEWNSFKNILIQCGYTKDYYGLPISDDKLICLYVYNGVLSYRDFNDNSGAVDLSNSSITEYKTEQLF